MGQKGWDLNQNVALRSSARGGKNAVKCLRRLSTWEEPLTPRQQPNQLSILLRLATAKTSKADMYLSKTSRKDMLTISKPNSPWILYSWMSTSLLWKIYQNTLRFLWRTALMTCFQTKLKAENLFPELGCCFYKVLSVIILMSYTVRNVRGKNSSMLPFLIFFSIHIKCRKCMNCN